MGRKLTIYLLEGTATGPKTVEIGNWSGKAIFSPRSGLKKLLERDEYGNPGIYFLRNESASKDFDDNIYIGEAEELRERLRNHIANKDFESTICFLSKDDMLTKAHIKYLESRIISLAKDANRSELENANQPKLPRLSEADISDMDYFIEQIRLILPTVGILSLVPTVQHKDSKSTIPDKREKIYQIKSSEYSARMYESDDGFIVVEGSEAKISESQSISAGWIKLRKKLVKDQTLVLSRDSTKYIFTEDTIFSSPSAASSVILGRQTPGPISWLDEQNKTYKEVQSNSIEV